MEPAGVLTACQYVRVELDRLSAANEVPSVKWLSDAISKLVQESFCANVIAQQFGEASAVTLLQLIDLGRSLPKDYAIGRKTMFAKALNLMFNSLPLLCDEETAAVAGSVILGLLDAGAKPRNAVDAGANLFLLAAHPHMSQPLVLKILDKWRCTQATVSASMSVVVAAKMHLSAERPASMVKQVLRVLRPDETPKWWSTLASEVRFTNKAAQPWVLAIIRELELEGVVADNAPAPAAAKPMQRL